jgi:hypothetical protein
VLYPWGSLWASRKYLVAQGILLTAIAAYVTLTFGAQAHDQER